MFTLNLLNMVYQKDIQKSVIQNQSAQLSRTNRTGIGLPKLTLVNAVTVFLTIQLKSINLVRHIAFTVVFQKCMVLLENEVCESMQNEISFTSNSKNKYSYTSVLSYLEPNGKNRSHETCSLPYCAAANIHEQKLCSTIMEKLYRKNLQSTQLIESATLKRSSFRLFVRTVY